MLNTILSLKLCDLMLNYLYIFVSDKDFIMIVIQNPTEAQS